MAKKKGIFASIFSGGKKKTSSATKRTSKPKKTAARKSKPKKANGATPKRSTAQAKPKTKKPTSKTTSGVRKESRVEAAYPHFRYYRKSKHPALIVGERIAEKNNKAVEEYRYRKVTHSQFEGGRNNEMVYPNPNPADERPMYISKRVRHDEKGNFENNPLPWEYKKK